MVRWKVRTASSGRLLGSYYGTKKEGIKWAKRHWKWKVELVPEKTPSRTFRGRR